MANPPRIRNYQDLVSLSYFADQKFTLVRLWLNFKQLNGSDLFNLKKIHSLEVVLGFDITMALGRLHVY